jgi:hypothetical protein
MFVRVGSHHLLVLAFGMVALLALTGCGGAGGGGGSSAPTPQVNALAPASAWSGAGNTTITLTGSNFQTNSVVQWNGTALVTTYTSAEQLSATIPATLLTSAGTAQVTVSNGGVTSVATAFTVNNPSPTLASLSPASGAAGAGAIVLTVTGGATTAGGANGFVSASVVMWNNTALATTFVNTSTLKATVPASLLASANSAQISVSTPAPGGGNSSSLAFYVYSNATTTGYVDAIPWSMAWDATHQRIYASVPDLTYGGGTYSGNLIAIDPITTNVVGQQAAGSSPDQIALSPDGSFLWLGEDDTGAIQRFSLPGLTPGVQIAPLTPIPGWVNEYAESLELAPGNANTLAVVYPDYVFIYDGVTPRVNSAAAYAEVDWVQWGADATVLYGSTGGVDPDDNWAYTVDSTGIASSIQVGYNFLPFEGEIHYDAKTGLLYHDDGQVFDPVSNVLVGKFDLSHFVSDTLCVVDSDQGVVFFLGQLLEPPNQQSNFSIEAFDQKTYALLRTIEVPNSVSLQGMITSFLRWGNAGLAFGVLHPNYATTGKVGGIFLVDGTFVNPTVAADTVYSTPIQAFPALTAINPQSTAAGSSNVTLTVTGSGFESGAHVYWGSYALPTTVLSSTELQVTVPAADLTSPGNYAVSLSNGDATTVDSGTLTFSVLPSGSTIKAFNLAALGLAWDASTNLLYAGILGSDPMYPDSVVGLNPTTGQVSRAQYVMADPWIVRATSDGSYLYAASMSTSMAAQIPLPDFGAPLSWNLGHAPYGFSGGSYYAQSLETAPGAPNTTAAALSQFNVIPGQLGGITVYDGATPRPVSASSVVPWVNDLYYYLCWGADASTLYATEGDTDYHFFQLGVNSSGVTLSNSFQVSYENFGALHFDSKSGHVFDDDGNVVNPANGSLITNLGSSGLVAIDSTLNRAYVLGQTQAQKATSSYTIAVYDMTTYGQVGTIVIPNVEGYPFAMVRWGSSGLAFSTYDSYANLMNIPMGMLYLVDSSTMTTGSAQFSSVRAGGSTEGVVRTWPKQFTRGLSRSSQRHVVMRPWEHVNQLRAR